MSPTRMAPKKERLGARITPQQKELIQHAAGLSGRSVTDFIVSSAEAAARETIRTYQVIQLTTGGTVNFVEALLNPPSSSGHMEAAARRYLELVDRA